MKTAGFEWPTAIAVCVVVLEVRGRSQVCVPSLSEAVERGRMLDSVEKGRASRSMDLKISSSRTRWSCQHRRDRPHRCQRDPGTGGKIPEGQESGRPGN